MIKMITKSNLGYWFAGYVVGIMRAVSKPPQYDPSTSDAGVSCSYSDFVCNPVRSYVENIPGIVLVYFNSPILGMKIAVSSLVPL